MRIAIANMGAETANQTQIERLPSPSSTKFLRSRVRSLVALKKGRELETCLGYRSEYVDSELATYIPKKDVVNDSGT